MNGGNKQPASTQAYLPISEIKEGVVLLRDGSLRSVLIVSSVNFALKSEQEKDAIISSYQGFLNSLNFPIQIVANSRKLDLTRYIESVRGLGNSQDNPLLKIQTQEYANFIEKLLEYSNIMEKRFYVVVPYFPAGVDVTGGVRDMMKRKKPELAGTFSENKKKLLSRVDRVTEGLASVGLRCSPLETKDLLELYYTSYNPDTAQNQKLVDVESLGQAIINGGGNKDATL
ncbi:MAG: TraC family protein [Patescibacteria group bacterium]|nr:TraC family protein [Patescibacteria group bacterium]